MGLRAPLEPLRKTVLERLSGNGGSRVHTRCDQEAKMEIPEKIQA
jgi:hypothetical protein